MPHCPTLLQTLRSSGFRITPQREMIIEALAHNSNHQSAEEVFAQIKKRVNAVNIATVYRTLDLLVEQGLASRVDLGDGRIVYSSLLHGSHIHLVCRQCGEVFAAEQSLLKPLGEELEAHYQFKADLDHVTIAGLCPDCQARSEVKRR